MMRLQTLEHVPFEGPAAIAHYADVHGDTLGRSRLYAGESLPGLSDFDFLAVMGGPMSVHEWAQHPWLNTEKRFLRQVLDAGKSVLGVCLGAQLLAEVLGGRVSRNPQREIGWHPVQLTPEGEVSPAFAGFPRSFTAFHWHGETFSEIPGATGLACSEACADQAFAVGAGIVGLQFHLETTAESMELLIANAEEADRAPGSFIQTPAEMRREAGRIPQLRGLLETLLGNMRREV